MLDLLMKTRLLGLFMALAMLAGCASVPAPQTARQSLGYTEATYTAVVQQLTDMRAQGMLSTSQIATAETLITRGNTALDAAHTALDGGDTGATLQGRLATLDTVIVKMRALIAQEPADE